MLFENEINGGHQTAEGHHVVPMERFSAEERRDDYGEDNQRHHFLNHLKLYERKRTTVVNEADAVGRYLAAIFKEGDAPREQDDCN